jgi:hypothetical protein
MAARMPQDSFRDKIGQEVMVSDFIAYGHAVGRSAALRIGKVLAITKTPSVRHRREFDFSIRVRGVEESYQGPQLCKRDGILQYPERIIKLPAVPEDIAKVLEGV